MAHYRSQPKRGDDKHLKHPKRMPGGKHPSGALGKGMKARGKKPSKGKGTGGGKSVARPGGKHGGVKASHGPTFGRVAPPMGPTQGSPKRAGTDLGGNRKPAKKLEERLAGKAV